MHDILTMILAGGKGERLAPLTEVRTKPAVPFGGKYRVIDFTLSNCLNSGLRKITVLTQYKSHSLDLHIRAGWNIFNPELNEFITPLPPQQRINADWYKGTADAVFQNMFFVEQQQLPYLLVLSGDHVYKMNYRDMYDFLIAKKADAVVSAIEVPIEQAKQFGVLAVDENDRITRFEEKLPNPTPLPKNPHLAYVSMGIYLFKTETLARRLFEDAQQGTVHDFGTNILPNMLKHDRVFAFPFVDKNKKTVKYWRDIGTLDAYWEANMDLISVDPQFNLYDADWPIRTYQGQYPPAKFVFAEDGHEGRAGVALDSIVCGGCIISGGRIQRSVLSPNVLVKDHALIQDSVVMENVVVGAHAKIKNAIIDKGVVIPANMEIGYNPEADRTRFTVTDSGLVAISKGMKFDAPVNSPG